ncbi:MAG: nitroreductase [Firmicutes bacterium]|nr:nitroreductase [Bacillota bacterium]
MELIQVEQEKCVRCGICAAVCPRVIIKVGAEGPECMDPDSCIACGHCVSVCPYSALNNIRAPLTGQTSVESFRGIDGDAIYQFLRSRRSIRCYKTTPVPREQLLRLMDIARFAPTGGNSQGISYLAIEDPETLRKITDQTINWIEEHKIYPSYVAAYRSDGKDVILRNAPCLVVAFSSKDFTRGRENTHFSLAYVELYASAIGLGSCWAGIFEACASSGYRPLLELLNLPEDKVVTGAIMVGYPEYRYYRLVDRNPLDLTFFSPVKEKNGYEYYVRDSIKGIVETYDEAVKIMKTHGLERTHRYTNGDATEYWTETGEVEEDDDLLYAPSITRLSPSGKFFNE